MTTKTRKLPKQPKPPKRVRAAKPANQVIPAKKSKPAKPPKPLAKAYVVFGADEYARPRAARFWARDVEPLAKAAAAINVRLVEVLTRKLPEILPTLPPGRLHASATGFLPYVTGDTYGELTS